VFTDEDLATYDTNKKMNPPLRTARDRQAVIDGLVDGTIDAIASDHAPHCAEEKDVEFAAAAFGVIGLETSLGIAITFLVNRQLLVPADLVEKMSVAPNRILNLGGGSLAASQVADVETLRLRVCNCRASRATLSLAAGSCSGAISALTVRFRTLVSAAVMRRAHDGARQTETYALRILMTYFRFLVVASRAQQSGRMS
jgi:hypothetical protein